MRPVCLLLHYEKTRSKTLVFRWKILQQSDSQSVRELLFDQLLPGLENIISGRKFGSAEINRKRVLLVPCFSGIKLSKQVTLISVNIGPFRRDKGWALPLGPMNSARDKNYHGNNHYSADTNGEEDQIARVGIRPISLLYK